MFPLPLMIPLGIRGSSFPLRLRWQRRLKRLPDRYLSRLMNRLMNRLRD